MADQPGQGKLVILSAPSGAGKTTIMKRVVESCPSLEFSVSATSRKPRHVEKHGVDYYFITPQEFREFVAEGRFVEWEEVYSDTHYGTLHSEMERIWRKGNTIIFDVDVKGGISLKEIFGERALSIFIMPPSIEVLEQRLVGRGTDSPEVIAKRVAKAREELSFAPRFDLIVVNEELDRAVQEVVKAVKEFI